MNRLSTTRSIARKCLSAWAIAAMPAMGWAQVSTYEYSESVGTYTEITAAEASYSLGEPTYWPPMDNARAWVNNEFFGAAGQSTPGGYLSGVYGPGYPIGFPFTFNGEVFDVIGISHSGWISFGKSSDGAQAVWAYASDHSHGWPFVQYIGGPDIPYKRNRVAGFGTFQLRMQDMSSLVPPGPVSSLRIATIGTAPNRTCVVQYKDFRASYSNTLETLINFQIRLNEADNSVEVRYGNMLFGYQSGGSVQVGLGGTVPEDFNSRMTVYEEPAFLYDWNITAAGQVNTDVCAAVTEEFSHPNGSGVPPVEGRTFKWSPGVCPPPAWPIAIADVSFESATAHWTPTGAQEYEWFLSGTNDLDGPEVASDITTDPEASFEGLDASTTYYLFVRGICDGEPGTWSAATPFETFGGALVECNGGVVTENYCSQQYSTKEWLYLSADGSPLRIEFQGGLVGNVGAESFKVWEGTGPVGPGTQFQGDLTGHLFESPTGAIYIRLITDAGACEAQDWYLPLQWRVGCKNCEDPLVNFTLGEVDCDNDQFYVGVNIFSMGSATSLSIENSLGLPATDLATTGEHTVGPFPADQAVVLTAQNPDNQMCYVAGTPIISDPCPVADCGPTTYTACYGDNDYLQWAYQSADGGEIGIRFLQGTIAVGDNGSVYNGLSTLDATPTAMPGNLLNALFTSGPPSTDHALVMQLQANNAMSCMDADPLFGTTQPWEYVVACYDGCVQPKATFADSCISTTAFMVNVKVTELGSTGSVTITNSAGSAPVTATALGTWPVGPFQANVPVTIDVEGASILCTYTSPGRTKDCSGWTEPDGISEMANAPLRVFPNPSNGTFQLELPQGSGIAGVEILDLTGRTVARQAVHTNNTSATLHLEHLPNGLYTVTAQGSSTRYISKISIQH